MIHVLTVWLLFGSCDEDTHAKYGWVFTDDRVANDGAVKPLYGGLNTQVNSARGVTSESLMYNYIIFLRRNYQ